MGSGISIGVIGCLHIGGKYTTLVGERQAIVWTMSFNFSLTITQHPEAASTQT
jgi:hypothetical protein